MILDLRRLKAERIAKGFTQEEVASKMGWKSRTPYVKRELGIISVSANELIKLALIFGYTKEDLGLFFN